MQVSLQKNRINFSNAKALRRAREMLKVTRYDLGARLNLSYKAIEKYENGRAELDEGKINSVLVALNLTLEQFKKIKKGKTIGQVRPKKMVFENGQRRSYQKKITKEVRVLKVLREMKRLTQYHASSLCGYSKPTIGHIENGRIEIPNSRITHIVTNYGFELKYFEGLMKEEILRDEIINQCIEKIISLNEEKLKIVNALLGTFNGG